MTRRVDPKGRSKGEDRFIKLPFWLVNSDAFHSLSLVARALLLEFKRRYTGSNNGDIHLSVREAAKAVNVAANTASNGLAELREKGFVRVKQLGSFTQKARHATTWILTEYDYSGQAATKDFMRFSKEDLVRMENIKNENRYQKLKPTVSKKDTEAQKGAAADTP